MVKWFGIFKQGIMHNIQVLFEQSDVDFDIREAAIQVDLPQSKETIISEALKVYYAIGNAEYRILIAHPQEEKFLFFGQRKIGHVEVLGAQRRPFEWEARALSDAQAIKIVNERIREIEEMVEER
jgi:hypothetical protein